MTKLFFADKDFSREIPRTRAKGYKQVIVSEELEMAAPYQFITEGNSLVAVPAEAADGGEECFTLLCREFGLVGWSTGLRSKVSVIFCDNGWMLVTLYKGGFVLNLDGQLMMPTVGIDTAPPKVVQDNIMWVDADKLLGYSKYLGDKGNFMYDYEFMLELAGDNAKGMGNFTFRHIEEETVDISLGHVALWEQQMENRRAAQEAKKQMSAISAYIGHSSGPMEFDEPDEDEGYAEEEEEEDDSGVDW